MTLEITRPLIRYHGGKWRLAPWIVAHLPPHKVYVEPFGGGASVLLRKYRSKAEVYNDLDAEIVNLFRTVRTRGHELATALELTPFARDEFDLSFGSSEDPLEQARRTVVRAYMGFGSSVTRICRDGRVMRTGFRSDSNRSGTTPANDWRNFPAALPQIITRLQGVVIENKDAVEVMRAHDGLDTVHYVDPPYVHSTRTADAGGSHRGYRHEMSDEQHRDLANALHALSGMVVLSGYDCDLYRELFGTWHRVEKATHADGARARVETLWFNEAAARRISRPLL